ncbi:hypothetical protein KKE48_00235 [Patescibacteria group bacterium]|nr:hypothetical protein [Patescibacteria group bacterium]MBU1499283.1 hypothetical protein [Patescibacteria group bacterium]
MADLDRRAELEAEEAVRGQGGRGKPGNSAKAWGIVGAVGGTLTLAGAAAGAIYNKRSFDRALKDAEEEVTGGAGNEPIQVTQNQYADYNFKQIGNIGLERTGIHLKDLSDPRALINKPFLRLAAKFGDDFLAPPVVDKDGKVVLEVSEAVVANWIEALNLNSAAAADFRQKYVHYRTHPDEFGQFLLENGASPIVVDFLSKAEELKLQDADPATWLSNDPSNPDRYEKLQQWLQGKGIVIGKIEGKTDLPKVAEVKRGDEVGVVDETRINELVVWADAKTDGSVGQMLGPMETLINMPIGTTAMHEAAAVDMAEFYQHESQKPLLANTGLPLVLTGLFLLRVGPSWPKEVIAKASERLEDVYYWFKLGQPERAMRNLMVLGKQAWDRVTGKRINPGANQ